MFQKVPERDAEVDLWVGRIQFFFRHQFAGEDSDLMIVKWYLFKESIDVGSKQNPQIVDINHKAVKAGGCDPPSIIQPLDALSQSDLVLLGKLDMHKGKPPPGAGHRFVIRLQTTVSENE